MSEKSYNNIKEQFRRPSWFSTKFAIFAVLLILLHINNHNQVESLMRKEAALKKEIEDLKYERITSSAKLMEMSKQSEVLKKMRQEGLGLEELTDPPRILE
ncbi:MAG: FtsL-like putative cell division protein [Bacteroidia bacterium]|nr:FtsL-like putative cell division protein [Bacteroidia bacterium]